jgi:predicted RNA-binding protein YlqC (UPF0109 family)
MEETLKIMIENLVDNKDEIEITSEENGNRVNFKVKVNKDEMGKVIGRQGKIAHSIRTVMKAVGNKEQKKVEVEFLD